MSAVLPTSIALFSLWFGAVPAPTHVEARVNPSEVKLGAPFVYDLAITHPASQRYELQATAFSASDSAFEMTSQARDRQDHGSEATTTFKIQMSLFELGAHPVPALNFEVTEGGTRTPWTAPSSASVTGLSTLPDDAQSKGAELEDIKPPEPVWVRSYRLLLIGLAALVLALGLYFLVRWWRRRAQRPAAEVPLLPLDARTLSALQRLQSENLPSQGKFREFHFRLSEILRKYLAERYKVDALECTSIELLQRLKARDTPGLHLDSLRPYLEESDYIKYARAESTPAACSGALQFTEAVVRQTYLPITENVPGNQLSKA